MAASLEVPGAARLARTSREAAAMLDEHRSTDETVASLVGRVAVQTAPRGRTGQTAASVRFGATADGAGVTVGARHAVPLHWGAPRINQRGNPWVARAWSSTEPELVDRYDQLVAESIRHITT
jgi:hypothetical protein